MNDVETIVRKFRHMAGVSAQRDKTRFNKGLGVQIDQRYFGRSRDELPFVFPIYLDTAHVENAQRAIGDWNGVHQVNEESKARKPEAAGCRSLVTANFNGTGTF